MTLGLDIADWLYDHVLPDKVYYHDLLLNDLGRLGVLYDASAHVLYMATGEIVEIPTYTAAELIAHPLFRLGGVTQPIEGRVVIGYEVAQALHALLWPLESPPGHPELGFASSFRRDMASIAQRGEKPYRDNPPGGWWHMETP